MTTSTKEGKVRIEGAKRYYKDAWMEKRENKSNSFLKPVLKSS